MKFPVVVAAVVAIGLVIAAGLAGSRAYTTLCAGPVDTYPAIAAAQANASQQAQTGQGSGGPNVLASGQAHGLALLLTIKQSDYVAFPAHVVAGQVLEWGGCPTSSSGDQWRKAAGHAWADGPARVAAGGLARTLGANTGRTSTLASLQAYALREPWHAANLGRVAALLR